MEDQVVNVCIGSLSNLSLNPIFKLKIGRIHVLVPALKVIAQSTNIVTVCRTAAGLLANLGVDTSLANLIVEFGGIRALSRMLDHEHTDPTFERNIVVALNNILTSNLSIRESVLSKIVEKLQFIRETSESFEINSLIINCLVALNADIMENTTSFHLAAKHGFTDILMEIVHEASELDDLDFDMKDGNSKTMMNYAVANDHEGVAVFLVKCGAHIESEDAREVAEPSNNKTALHSKIIEAQEVLNDTRVLYRDTIQTVDPTKVSDLNNLIYSGLSDYEMARANNAL